MRRLELHCARVPGDTLSASAGEGGDAMVELTESGRRGVVHLSAADVDALVAHLRPPAERLPFPDIEPGETRHACAREPGDWLAVAPRPDGVAVSVSDAKAAHPSLIPTVVLDRAGALAVARRLEELAGRASDADDLAVAVRRALSSVPGVASVTVTVAVAPSPEKGAGVLDDVERALEWARLTDLLESFRAWRGAP